MDSVTDSSATMNLSSDSSTIKYSHVNSTQYPTYLTSYSHVLNNSDENANGTLCFHGYPVVVPLAIFMIAFMIFAIVGNIMVILTIVRHRGMRTRTNMFIINLAVADILVAALDMPVSLITILEGDWVFGDALCQLNGFTMALFLICSIHTLMYISIHKYISITRPFSRAMTPMRIKMMIAAAWLWSIICATGPLVGWNTISYKMGASQCGPSLPKEWRAFTHSLFITTSNYIIPLVVMSFCYYRIFREINDHMNRIRETSNINLQNSVSQQKKISVTLFLVLACFLICWTPFVIYSTAVAFMKNKDKMPSIVNPLAYWCGYMNSACNPIIYAFRSPSFRQGYKETITCGAPLSTISGDSFRSRSARGSIKANSNAISGSGTRNSHRRLGTRPERKQKRLLSQTSWMSLPIIPYLVRSMSSASSSSRNQKTNRQISRNRCDSITKENGPIAEENESTCEISGNIDGRFECRAKEQKENKTEKELCRNESFNYLKDDAFEQKINDSSEEKSVDLNYEIDVLAIEQQKNSSLQNLNSTSKPLLIQQISGTDVTVENFNRANDSTNEALKLEQTDDLHLNSSLSENVA